MQMVSILGLQSVVNDYYGFKLTSHHIYEVFKMNCPDIEGVVLYYYSHSLRPIPPYFSQPG